MGTCTWLRHKDHQCEEGNASGLDSEELHRHADQNGRLDKRYEKWSFITTVLLSVFGTYFMNPVD
jgi:hypothetical protein